MRCRLELCLGAFYTLVALRVLTACRLSVAIFCGIANGWPDLELGFITEENLGIMAHVQVVRGTASAAKQLDRDWTLNANTLWVCRKHVEAPAGSGFEPAAIVFANVTISR